MDSKLLPPNFYSFQHFMCWNAKIVMLQLCRHNFDSMRSSIGCFDNMGNLDPDEISFRVTLNFNDVQN
ncbi:hypothetical protein BGP_4988 [Beggiatoa sp. PS]|nr:hypothetical protein BGP_4988 [Beggiatoa sp. PS]